MGGLPIVFHVKSSIPTIWVHLNYAEVGGKKKEEREDKVQRSKHNEKKIHKIFKKKYLLT